jgi:hypothetical protein
MESRVGDKALPFYEKAGVYAAKGDQTSALRILDSYCKKTGPNARVYSCNLASSLRKGFRPSRLGRGIQGTFGREQERHP